MKSTYSTLFNPSMLASLAAVTLLVSGGSSQAAVITSTDVTGNVIASNTTGGTGAILNFVADANTVAGSNTTSLGQTFTTGTLGINNQVDAIYVRTLAGQNAQGGTLGIVFYRTTSSTQVQSTVTLATESGTWSQSTTMGPLGETWIKIQLANTIALLDNTQYGFNLTTAGTATVPGAVFQWDGTNPDAMAGGQAVSSGTATAFNGNLWTGNGAVSGDRVFAVTTIPEPSAALLGGLGLLALLRRRR